MINNKINLIEFPVNSGEDIIKETVFFNEVFGWNFKKWGDKYADTSDSGLTFGINANENQQTMPMTVIYCDNIEQAKNKVINAGGKITHDIYSFPGGKRFHFTDPIGNQLAIWSR